MKRWNFPLPWKASVILPPSKEVFFLLFLVVLLSSHDLFSLDSQILRIRARKLDKKIKNIISLLTIVPSPIKREDYY